MPDSQSDIRIAEWDSQHARYAELLAFIEEQGQTHWASFTAGWHLSSHLLAALRGQALAGFLRYVVQPIGPDAGCPPIQLQGAALLEAKVLAFAVRAPDQRQGIGRRLQEDLIERAKARGCYQVRSHSAGDQAANHQLKLALGFGVHPIVRGEDQRGAYFILPLQTARGG